MDMFKDHNGVELDLDDITIYPSTWIDMEIFDFFNECTRDVGDSIFYMDFLHKETDWGSQKLRVVMLGNELVNIRNNFKNLLWSDDDLEFKEKVRNRFKKCFMKWRYRFLDEVENQC